VQFCPCAGIIVPLLPGLRDLAQLFLILPPRLIRLKIVTGRIRIRIAVLQRRHGGAQYGYGLSAAEKRDKTVGIADSNGLVADLPKVARATLTAASVVGPTAQNVTAGDFDALEDALKTNTAYANLHTTAFPVGGAAAKSAARIGTGTKSQGGDLLGPSPGMDRALSRRAASSSVGARRCALAPSSFGFPSARRILRDRRPLGKVKRPTPIPYPLRNHPNWNSHPRRVLC
jgi:hypothetical protein